MTTHVVKKEAKNKMLSECPVHACVSRMAKALHGEDLNNINWDRVFKKMRPESK